MSEFDINRAARMMRAGNELSETNRKLREAVCSFVNWFSGVVESYQLPSSDSGFGWVLENLSYGRIRLGFKCGSAWYSVINEAEDASQINQVVMCCRALAGPEGEQLISWLEQRAKERGQMLAALQGALNSFRSAMNPATPR